MLHEDASPVSKPIYDAKFPELNQPTDSVWHGNVSALTPHEGTPVLEDTPAQMAEALHNSERMLLEYRKEHKVAKAAMKRHEKALDAEERAFLTIYGDEFCNHVHATLADVRAEGGWAVDEATMHRILDEKLTQKLSKVCQLMDQTINIKLLADDAEDSFTGDKKLDDEIESRFDAAQPYQVKVGRVTYRFHRLSLKSDTTDYTPDMIRAMFSPDKKK